MWMVTQPNNDLRSRATSIFERLRGSGPDGKGTRAEEDHADSGSHEPQSEFPPDVVPHPGPPPDPAPPRSLSRFPGVEGEGAGQARDPGAPNGLVPTSVSPDSGTELQAGDSAPPLTTHEGEPGPSLPTTADTPPDLAPGGAGSTGPGAGSSETAFVATTSGESIEPAGAPPAGESQLGPEGEPRAGGGGEFGADESGPGEETDVPGAGTTSGVDTETPVVDTTAAVDAADGSPGAGSADDQKAPAVSDPSGGLDPAAAGASDPGAGTGPGQTNAGELEGGTPPPANADASLTSAAAPSPAPAATGSAATVFPPSPPSAPATLADPIGARTHPSARNRPLPRCLAVANQKGGVGKTTTAVNLGAALAELDYRVLVVDLDPQGNATTGLGINARNLDSSIYDVILHDVPVEDVIEPTTLKNLFVVPSTIDLAGAEIELVPVFSRELRLRKALEPIVGDFDFLLIDCPPSLGLLTINGLAAATEVAVPIQCEYYALEGLGQLLRNVGLVQTNLNGDLEVSTIILTMYDARTKLAEQVADEVRQYFGDRVCRNVVPRTVRLSEAPSFGQPIIVFDPSSRGSIAYRELAKEVSGGAPKRTR
jgi:chromosome partitioning protein